jgi:hypothetical protein
VSQLTHIWHDYVLIRCSVPRNAASMATRAQKIEAEKRMRDLLEQSGLPQPDYVEHGFTCIRLFFEDTKTVVVIDIDDPDAIDGTVEPGDRIDAPRRRRRHA